MRGKHFTYTMKRLAGLLLFMAVVLLPVGQAFAAYNVNISGDPSANGAWSGASLNIWTPNGSGSNVSVVDILTKLNAGGVTITEASNINVNAALPWNANTLTLNANNDININAVMSAGVSSGLVMSMGTGTLKVGFAPGEANGFIGRVDFPGRTGNGFLTINGAGYTVINSLGAEGSSTGLDLQGIKGIQGDGALAGKYVLGADIDASSTSEWNNGEGFVPIGGSEANSFTGIFDGLGHTVNGLVIDRAGTDNVGLFGFFSEDAILRNVGVAGGYVMGNNFVGGLVGNAAGLVSNTYYSGVVSGNDAVGGIVGSTGAAINSSYSTGNVSGIGWAVGGLVGMNNAIISGSYSTARVGGIYVDVGGLVGSNNTMANIENSYATGTVASAGSFVGGLVGSDYGGSISKSYSTGAISGTSNVGGLVGDALGTVTNSFWDKTVNNSLLVDNGIGTPKTTAEMKTLATFVGWDISTSAASTSIWRITEGQSYPLLRTFVPPSMATSGSATDITTTSATLNGMVNASHSNAAVSFEYGLTTAYGTIVAATPAIVTVGSGNTAVSAAISGLTPGQTYHYRVVATNSIGTDYGEDTVFTAPQLSQTISGFSPPATATFGDVPITLSANASSVLPVVFSVTSGPGLISDNKFLHTTGAGTIVLRASQPGSLSYSAAPNVTASIVVGKAAATVTLGSLSHTYSGTAKTATATASTAINSNLPVEINITYDGSATAPTNAGTYTVVATIDDVNYTGSSTPGTLTIAKVTPTVNWATPTDIYLGTVLSATQLNATASVPGTFAYTPAAGTILPVDNSSLDVAFTPTDTSNYNSANASVSIKVNSKLDPTINWVTPSAMVYGTALSAAQLNASASVSVIDNTNVPGSFVYTSAAGAVVTAGTMLNAGSQPLIFTFTPDDTVTYNNVTGAVILTINKAAASVTLSNLNQTYSGAAKAATATTSITTDTPLVIDITYAGSATAPVNTGTYDVVATINDLNFSGTATGTLVITPLLTVAVAGTGTGTVTSSPAGISCNKSSAADVACANTFSGSVDVFATPSVLSLFGGWSSLGGDCSGLGACSVSMTGKNTVTVTATFNLAPLLRINGTIYPSLQEAYEAAINGDTIQLLDTTVAGTLTAGSSITVTLKGGYDAGYTNNSGTTALTAPLTIKQGTLVIDRIVIK